MRGYLDPGETVRFEARPHTAALFRPLSRSMLLALGGGVLVGLSPPALGVVGAILLVIGALLALRAVMRWDRTSLVEQETIVGRAKGTGAPLTGKDEFDEPDFTAVDGEGEPVIALEAHETRTKRHDDFYLVRARAGHVKTVRSVVVGYSLKFKCVARDDRFCALYAIELFFSDSSAN